MSREPASSNLTKSFLDLSRHNKAKLDGGVPTLIPFSFPTMKKHLKGIVPGSHVVISAISGAGKSRFTRFLCLQEAASFAKRNGMQFKVILNSLEESKEKVVSTLVGNCLEETFGYSLGFHQLHNYNEGESLSQKQMQEVEHCSRLVDEQYGDIIDVVNIPNPVRFYKYVCQYLDSIGTFYKKGKKATNAEIGAGDYDKFEYDKPCLVFTISDTVNKYVAVEGKSQYATLKEFSGFYCRQKLGLVCNVTNVLVIQQHLELAKIKLSHKGEKLIDAAKPSLGNFADNKSLADDATLVIGLFNPLDVEADNYNGYRNLSSLKGGLRFISAIILKTREGSISYPANEIPLFADLGKDYFFEAPKPGEPELSKYY